MMPPAGWRERFLDQWYPYGAMNEILHPDGRVELRDTSRIERSPLYNHDLAPVPIARAHLDDLQLRRAVDQHGALHPDLHAGVGADGRRA